MALPAWLASMTQLPTLLKVTVVLLIELVVPIEPVMEHTEEPVVKVTGLPEPPPDAATS